MFMDAFELPVSKSRRMRIFYRVQWALLLLLLLLLVLRRLAPVFGEFQHGVLRRLDRLFQRIQRLVNRDHWLLLLLLLLLGFLVRLIDFTLLALARLAHRLCTARRFRRRRLLLLLATFPTNRLFDWCRGTIATNGGSVHPRSDVLFTLDALGMIFRKVTQMLHFRQR